MFLQPYGQFFRDINIRYDLIIITNKGATDGKNTNFARVWHSVIRKYSSRSSVRNSVYRSNKY